MKRVALNILIGAAGFQGIAAGQGNELGRRIDAAPEGPVGISFAPRRDVCGYGFGYLRIGQGGFGEGSYTVWSDGSGGSNCEAGPIRVFLTRVEGRVTGVRVGAGSVVWPRGTTDLGTVGAPVAARYLVDLARGTDGRLGREAITGAVAADSADIGPALLALARDPGLSRGLRETAVSWLGRECGVAEGAASRALLDGLRAVVADPNAPVGVRSRAVTALARAEGSEAVLVRLVDGDEPAVAGAATTALGRLGSRVAREAVRRVARDTTRARAVRVEAIKALGGRDASAADLAALRGLWQSLQSEELKGAVLQSAAETGGDDNAKWLLGLMRDATESSAVRAKAVSAGEQAGIGASELIKVYDEAGDRRVKGAVLDALMRIGDQASRAKVARVAESDTDPELRRSAVNKLTRDGDRRMVGWLQGVVEKSR